MLVATKSRTDMQTRGPRLLFALLVTLAAAAAAVLAVEELARSRKNARGEEFQRLVGGLGFGPALDLSQCTFGFDPRLEATCSQDVGPIPGGGWFCPYHAGSIFYYPPLESSDLMPVEDNRDALLP